MSYFRERNLAPQLNEHAASGSIQVVDCSGHAQAVSPAALPVLPVLGHEASYPILMAPQEGLVVRNENHPAPLNSRFPWLGPTLEPFVDEGVAFRNQECRSDWLTNTGHYVAAPQSNAADYPPINGPKSDSGFGNSIHSTAAAIPVKFIPIRPRRQKRARGEASGVNQPVSRGTPDLSLPQNRVIIDWEAWKGHFKHLDVTLQHTRKEIAFEMGLVYNMRVAEQTLNNKFQKWEDFAKNKKKRAPAPRPRPSPNPRRRIAPALPGLAGGPDPFAFKRHPFLPSTYGDPSAIPSINAEPYIYQYKMLHFIEVLTAGIAHAGSCNSLSDQNFAWQLASDRCHGITSLFESRREPIAGFLFSRFLNDLTSSVRPQDPMFLVQIWQLCISLSRVHFHRRDNAGRLMLLRLFLHRMRQSVSELLPGQEHPLPAILGTLQCVLVSCPESLKWTLGIGCWKSKAMLDRVFGREADSVSLETGAFCVQNWRSSFEVDFRKLESRYRPALNEFGPGPLTEDKIGILYGYTSALARISPVGLLHDDTTPVLLNHLAVLRDQSSRYCRHAAEARSLTYGTAVSAFVFSSELVAKYLLEGGKYKGVLQEALNPCQPYRSYLDEAIETLRVGDLDCQIRAAELSRRLGKWLKAYCLGDINQKKGQKGEGKRGKRPRGRDRASDFKQEKHRFAQILNRIFRTPGDLQFKQNANKKGWQKELRRKQNETRESVLVPLSREAGISQPDVPHKRRTCRTCHVTFPSRRDMFIHFQHLKHRCGRQPEPQGNPWRQPVEIGPTIEPRVLEVRP